MKSERRFTPQRPEQVNWPFKLITAWIYPVRGETCQACKQCTSAYEWRYYIDLFRQAAPDMGIYNLTYAPWERAIKEQARGISRRSLTIPLCEQCMLQWVAGVSAYPELYPLGSIEITIEGKDRDEMTSEELAHDTRKTTSFPTTKEGLEQARGALLKRSFEIWKTGREAQR